MPLRCRKFCLLLFIVGCSNVSANSVWVSLFNNAQVQSVVISAYTGDLLASGDMSQFTIAKGQAVNVVLHDSKIVVSNERGWIGAFERLTISGDCSDAVVRLRPVLPLSESRNYDAAICLYADIGRIRMINQLDEAKYLAGVIEAETGAGRTAEFYKAFAVICRTYLYGHANRHVTEGFHLCDETHCQAYKGKCRHDSNIPAAVKATDGIVIVDERAQPISATHHANCGGETESAKNAWQTDMPCLLPVNDPFCTAYPGAQWTKSISLDDWISYLMKNGFKLNPQTVTDFSFRQTNRKQNYIVSDFALPFKQIRNDWNLRSSFFSVSVGDDKVMLKGHGYGHGVGLCQEGAMEMGKRGHKYEDIIKFYYRNIRLVSIADLQINIPEI